MHYDRLHHFALLIRLYLLSYREIHKYKYKTQYSLRDNDIYNQRNADQWVCADFLRFYSPFLKYSSWGSRISLAIRSVSSRALQNARRFSMLQWRNAVTKSVSFLTQRQSVSVGMWCLFDRSFRGAKGDICLFCRVYSILDMTLDVQNSKMCLEFSLLYASDDNRNRLLHLAPKIYWMVWMAASEFLGR